MRCPLSRGMILHTQKKVRRFIHLMYQPQPALWSKLAHQPHKNPQTCGWRLPSPNLSKIQAESEDSLGAGGSLCPEDLGWVLGSKEEFYQGETRGQGFLSLHKSYPGVLSLGELMESETSQCELSCLMHP